MTSAPPDPPAMATIPDLQIMGFDLGNGETAVATVHTTATTGPLMVELAGGRRSLVTAVAFTHDGRVLVGDDAFADPARELVDGAVRLKRPDFDDPARGDPLRAFVGRVLAHLAARNSRYAADNPETRFVVGAPSGWEASLREAYARLLGEAGMTRVSVVPESRAAFFFCRESGELRVSLETLRETLLIIDVGSSTTDFTVAHHLRERPLDFGHNALGGGVLDEALLARILADHPERARLETLLAEQPAWRPYLELVCRRAKEDYFNATPERRAGGVGRFEVLPSEPRLLFEVTLTPALMETLLTRPLPALEGKGWRQAFRDHLQATRETIGTPALILLTGGAARMDCVADLTREIFPDARVERGEEPEFAIARGLALYGRASVRIGAFRLGVAALTADDGPLAPLLKEALPRLADHLGRALAAALTEEVLLPTVLAWRTGPEGSLSALQENTRRAVAAWQESEAAGRALQEGVAAWYEEIRPAITRHTDPLCDRFGLQRALLRPPARLDVMLADLDTEHLERLPGLPSLRTPVAAAGLVAGGLVPFLFDPTGLSHLLMATGAAVGTAVTGAAAAVFGADRVRHWLRDVPLPGLLRRGLSRERLTRQVREEEEELAGRLAAQARAALAADPDQADAETRALNAMVRQTGEVVRLGIGEAVRAQAREAELLIL